MRIVAILPTQISMLAQVDRKLTLDLHEDDLTIDAVLEEIENRYPQIRGALRDATTGRRRPFIRFYLAQEDLSNRVQSEPLPREVIELGEPFTIIASIAGG